MKRIALLLFGLTMTVGMIGCAKEEPKTPAPSTTETTPAETTPAPAEEPAK
jgi:hypothetical protein